MTPKRSRKHSSSGSGAPAPGNQSPKKQRQAGREASRALARAGTRGSSDRVADPLLLWSLAFIAVAIVVVAVAVFVSQPSGSPGAVVAPNVVTPSNIASSGRTLGNSAIPVTVDVYGDFRCSACLRFTTGGAEQNLVSNYVATGKAKLVWHDLLSIDRSDGGTASRDAANAAWCAADQGKFWVMHDWLYANQGTSEAASAFTLSRLSDIGKAAGLDMSKFQPCLDQGRHDAAIAAEAATTPPDATGTPAIFVNGKFVGDPSAKLVPTSDEIAAAIDAEYAPPKVSPSPS
jgi:protein-disulfide isomerase